MTEANLLARLARELVDATRTLDVAEGMTISEFARWAGISRSGLSEHLVDIPPGPVPPLPVGKVPVRRIGSRRRIFKRDFVAMSLVVGGTGHAIDQEAASGSAERPAWHRQIAELRRRYADGG